MSRMVGKDGTVIAFEPTEKFNLRLRRNLELNKCANVVVHKLIVSDQIESHEISVSDQTASIVQLNDSEHKETVQSTTLDVELKSLRSLSLIKIDVDGWDFHVLNGAQEVILKHQPVIIVECTRGEGSEPLQIFKLLKDLNYDMYLDSDRGQKFPLTRDDFESLSVTQKSFNVVATSSRRFSPGKPAC